MVAVIEKIDNSEIFEESQWFRLNKNSAKTFLRILAFIKSDDGRINSTGGIWNITEWEFNDTQAYIRNKSVLQQRMNASSILPVDWLQNITYSNMSVPMYSGLAIMILLHKIAEKDMTVISDHERLWVKCFGGEISKWRDKRNDLEVREGRLCKSARLYSSNKRYIWHTNDTDYQGYIYQSIKLLAVHVS